MKSKAESIVNRLLSKTEGEIPGRHYSGADDPSNLGSGGKGPDWDTRHQDGQESEEDDDIFQTFLDLNRYHNFEMDSGVRRFEEVVRALDPNYDDIRTFLADNPGAIDAMIEWIREWVQRSPEWKANLRDAIADDPAPPGH